VRARTWAALAVAAAWGTGLLVAALLLPVYASESGSVGPDGSLVRTSGSATLVEANGAGILVVAAAPLAAAVCVGALLAARTRHPAAGTAAWGVVALLAALAVLGLLSLGIFLVPVVLSLALAASTRPCAHSSPAATGAPARTWPP
jgi:hypothetical protein